MALAKSKTLFFAFILITSCSRISTEGPTSSPPVYCEFERGVWCPLSVGLNMSFTRGIETEYNEWSFSQPHWEQHAFVIREHYSCKNKKASKAEVIARKEETINGKIYNSMKLEMTNDGICELDILTEKSDNIYSKLSQEMSRTAVAICFENDNCGSETLWKVIEKKGSE